MKSIKILSKYIPFAQSNDKSQEEVVTTTNKITNTNTNNNTNNTDTDTDTDTSSYYTATKVDYKSLYEELAKRHNEFILSSKLEIERLQFDKIILQRDIDEKDDTIKRYEQELSLSEEYIKTLEDEVKTKKTSNTNNNNNNNYNNYNNEYNNDSSQVNITSSTIFSKVDLWTPISLLKTSEALEVLRSSPTKTNSDQQKSPMSSEKIAKLVAAVTISSKQKTVSKTPEKYKKRVGFKV